MTYMLGGGLHDVHTKNNFILLSKLPLLISKIYNFHNKLKFLIEEKFKYLFMRKSVSKSHCQVKFCYD